jgi:hypothetical protein
MQKATLFDSLDSLESEAREREQEINSAKIIEEMGSHKCKCGTVLNWKNKSDLCSRCERKAMISSIFGQTPPKIRESGLKRNKNFSIAQRNLFEPKKEEPTPVLTKETEGPKQIIEKKKGNAGITPVMRVMGIATKMYGTTAKAVRMSGRGYGPVDEVRPVVALALTKLGMRPEEIKKFLGVTVNVAPLLAKGKRVAQYDLRAQKVLSETEKLVS